MSTESGYASTVIGGVPARLRQLRGIYGRLNRSAQVSFWTVVGIVLIAAAAPLLAPFDPATQTAASLTGPSLQHPLGTDLFGRDILSRLIYGARASLLVGIGAVGIAVTIGVPLGSVAGYVGGWLDEVIMRSMDMVISIPALVLGLAIIGTIGASLTNVIIVIAIVYSPQYARVIRGSVLSEKEEEYVEAATNTGLDDKRILLKHIIPNAFTPVLVQATYHVATAIIIEASLSFLGLGVQPPTPTWGVMIADGRQYLPTEWWISTFPGLAIMVTVLAFNVLGDGLQDEFDPRSVTQQDGGV